MSNELKPEAPVDTRALDEERELAEQRRLAEEDARRDKEVDWEMARKSRRAFLIGGAAALGGFGVFEWIKTRRMDSNIPWPLRRVLDTNAELWRDYFNTKRLAPEFDKSEAPKIFRVNARVGMDDIFDPADADWKLSVVNSNIDSEDPVELQMDEIRKMPRLEHTTVFKCVEGWSQKVTWAGLPFTEFAKQYPPPDAAQFVGMETPDGEYYVSLDLASAMQPQTILAYEMNGDPLEEPHGAPLRLVIPTKYGIKNLKRIGKIFYAVERPRDYWAERGYDWYAGL